MEFKEGLPMELLYANDLVLMVKTIDVVNVQKFFYNFCKQKFFYNF